MKIHDAKGYAKIIHNLDLKREDGWGIEGGKRRVQLKEPIRRNSEENVTEIGHNSGKEI